MSTEAYRSSLGRESRGFVFLYPAAPTMPIRPQRVPSFCYTKEKIEVREVCVTHGAPLSGWRDTTSWRSIKSLARGNQRRGGVITADGIVFHLGVFWKANLHHQAVIKACFFFFFYETELISFLFLFTSANFFLFSKTRTTFMRERQSSVAFRGRHGIAITHRTATSARFSSFNLLFLSEHSWRVGKDPDENMHSQPRLIFFFPPPTLQFFLSLKL